MGFAKLEEGEDEGGEGERDRSLLVSLPLSSENMMRLRILFFLRRDAKWRVCGRCQRVEYDIRWVGIQGVPDDIWKWGWCW